MTDHPLTETAAAEMYGTDEEGHTLYAWRNPERAWVVRAMGAAFDAGREQGWDDAAQHIYNKGWEGVTALRKANPHRPVQDRSAEEVDLPTEFGDVILNPRWGARSYARAVHLGEGVWAAEVTPGADVYTHLARDLCGATLLDGTRARRDGEHEDGTPRFVKVEER